MLGNPNTPQGERSLEDTEEERRGGGAGCGRDGNKRDPFPLDT